jgi:hypothetical protein
MKRVLHIKTFLTTQKNDDEQCNYSLVSFVPWQHKEENNDE